jgi:hypothetical protein
MMFWIVASCAFDPRNPNAPCNDTPHTSLFGFVVGIAIAVGIITIAALVVSIVRGRNKGTDEEQSGSSVN